VLLAIQPGTSVQVPRKVYDYLGARRPILALTPEGATADLVRRSGIGLVVPPDDVGAIQSALAAVYQGWRAGQQPQPNPEVVQHCTVPALTRRLAAAFESLCPSSEGGP